MGLNIFINNLEGVSPMKQDESDLIIHDLLFDSNMSIGEIAQELCWDISKTRRRIKHLGLDWVRRRDHKVSRGQSALTESVKKLLPGEKVVNEHHIGDGQRLDIYCPSYKLGVEYHGRQHFEFVEHFHKNQYGFNKHQMNDKKKLDKCLELGIVLVVFRFNDRLSGDIIYERIYEAIRQSDAPKQEPKESVRGNPYYERAKERNREYQKEQYRRLKKERKQRQRSKQLRK